MPKTAQNDPPFSICDLCDMDEKEFARLVDRLTINRIPTMKPPRRPRGEKPATTIRYQRQQIGQLADIIADLRAKLTIAEGKMGEAQELAHKFENEADYLEEQLADARNRETDISRQLAKAVHSLAFFRGYFAGAENNRVPGQAVTVRRSGDPSAWPPGEEAGEEGGAPDALSGLHQELSRAPWRNHALHPTDTERRTPDRQEGRTSEEFTIGAVHDGPIHPRRVNRTYPLPDGPLYRR